MKYINMTGRRIGNLIVIQRSNRTDPRKRAYWICRCDCGNIIDVRGDRLRDGTTKHCTDCKITGGRPSVFIRQIQKPKV